MHQYLKVTSMFLLIVILFSLVVGCVRKPKTEPPAGELEPLPITDELDGWTLYSPDRAIKGTVKLTEYGGLTYTVVMDGQTMIQESALGINLSGYADFTDGLEFISAAKATSTDESYEMLTGKFSTYRNNFNEWLLTFCKDEKQFQLLLRAYSDGFAFRYIISGEGSFTVEEETTQVQFPQDATLMAQKYKNDYENSYNTYSLQNLNGDFGMPMLVQVKKNDWLLYMQAELTGTYGGTMLKANPIKNGLFSFTFTHGQPTAALPFTSPWRAAVLGTPKEIAETMLPENLCEASKIKDASWVKPGITSWSWLTTGTSHQGNGALQEQFLDLAAEFNWEYVLLDHGWLKNHATNEYYDWFTPLMQKAAASNVAVWVWEDIANLNSLEKLSRLNEWKAKGIVGVKVDYFYSEAQNVLKYYDDLNKAAAEAGLLMNYHGSNLPSGERRTWPNIVAREGVNGAEHRGQMRAYDNTVLPFSRNALGPMDYTPVITPSRVGNNYTATHGVALSVVFECGVTALGDAADAYKNSNAYDFFINLPSAWDETNVLSGEPGKSAVVARRSGDDWFVGAICNDALTIDLPMSFLGDGTYFASVYRDASLTVTSAEYTTVTKTGSINLPMLKSGGAAIKITKIPPKAPDSIGLSKTDVSLMEKQITSIGVIFQPADANLRQITWSTSNANIATVSNGVITAVKAGTATITAATTNNKTANVSVTVTKSYSLNNRWSIVQTISDSAFITAPDELTFNLIKNDIWKNNGNGTDIYLTDAPSGNFEVTVKVIGNLSSHVQSAGLIVWQDKDHYVSTLRRYHNTYGGKCFAMISENGSSNAVETPALKESDIFDQHGINSVDSDVAYLKVVKNGTRFTGYMSIDGDRWIEIYYRDNASVANASSLKIGLFATGDTTAEIKFKDFRINGETVLFT